MTKELFQPAVTEEAGSRPKKLTHSLRNEKIPSGVNSDKAEI
jgi:hypothetical protein